MWYGVCLVGVLGEDGKMKDFLLGKVDKYTINLFN